MSEEKQVYICENCGKEHDGSYGSGRFCCKSCVSSHAAKKGHSYENNKWNGSEGNLEALKRGNDTRIKRQMEEAFIEDSKVSNLAINNYLINYLHWEHKCAKCGLSEWQGQKIPLELHHKNGNNRDNRLENLEYLCLNCHAITESFRGKNINTGKIKVSDDDLISALMYNSSIRQALLDVGLSPRGGNYNRAYKLLYEIKNKKEYW